MIVTVNPATGEELHRYDELDEAGIDRALDRAADAFGRWRRSPLEERTALLARLAGVYEGNIDRLARQASLEMGKTFASAKAEVAKCAALFRHLAENGPAMLEPEVWSLPDGARAEGHWLPLGPVLAVMPWNFPYWQVVRFLAPTILAGNVGLLKHASSVQGVAALLEEMMGEAGAPEGLFQNLPIRARAVEGIIADDRVVAATLTGSEGAGAAVAEAAGRHLKKVVLELGGSDPFIVMPSADLDDAVRNAVRARIQNTGQSCICGKRMIVHGEIYDAFLERFVDAMAQVRAGDPFDEASDMGPLSSAEQRDTVLKQVATAREEGATVVLEPRAPDGPGAYLTAGVLTDVPPDSATARDEIFGPVAQVCRAADIDEAIARANDIPFGLGSSVWTQDSGEQDRFIREIEAGMTAVNQVLASDVRAPFGGTKKSGHGRELSEHGLREFMNLKTVMLPR
ncbi:NAD-dependent succinate-semialdehyde dehydrogenase [Erythrobacteraceae bacterium CFH 75059]|uniref:NAD-dependent succinate-semialdehyde dehydrogenase n=1 Tax=Qipengyuania thermophila TaxID=2509361 RepID=UPI00101F434D|nr:NAD-dependent succinate-semialdehyde dehydrogenase [Qipengyuania thermophila]TCD06534.1 NAD-dependent succinate-semialdehyde dehydrogenase [Erythrobacteraceae bacterium CFH 75059]